MLGFNTPNDYGKNSIKIRNNKRVLNDKNGDKNSMINIKSPIEQVTLRIKQKLKILKKILKIIEKMVILKDIINL